MLGTLAAQEQSDHIPCSCRPIAPAAGEQPTAPSPCRPCFDYRNKVTRDSTILPLPGPIGDTSPVSERNTNHHGRRWRVSSEQRSPISDSQSDISPISVIAVRSQTVDLLSSLPVSSRGPIVCIGSLLAGISHREHRVAPCYQSSLNICTLVHVMNFV